jgi:TolB-like protein/Tfp pilus assembly protein PilF
MDRSQPGGVTVAAPEPLHFVSYSRSDAEIAERLVTDLRDRGVGVWFDQHDIPPGVRWDTAIDEALHNATSILVLLSPQATRSENVLDEIHLALEEGHAIFPVLIEPCRVPYRISRREWIDLADYERGVSQLCTALAGGDGPAPKPPGEVGSAITIKNARERLPSVAVMPLRVLSTDPEAQMIAEGLHGEIVASLSLHPDLVVLGAGTMLGYRDDLRSVQELAQELQVGHIITGQFQKAGARIRLKIEHADCTAGFETWGEKFDRELEDVFELQDLISRAVAHRLRLRLQERERAAARRLDPKALDAWQLFQRAQSAGMGPDGQREAIELLERAVELDPEAAPARAALASRISLRAWFGELDRAAKALDLAEEALSRAPRDPQVLMPCAIAFSTLGQQDRGLALAERALDVNPSLADAWAFTAIALANSNRNEEALAMIDYAFELSPGDPMLYSWHANRVVCYANLDDWDEALVHARRSVDHNGGWFWSQMVLAQCAALTDHPEEALRAWEKAKALNPIVSLGTMRFWLSHSTLTEEQMDRTISSLEKAGCS